MDRPQRDNVELIPKVKLSTTEAGRASSMSAQDCVEQIHNRIIQDLDLAPNETISRSESFPIHDTKGYMGVIITAGLPCRIITWQAIYYERGSFFQILYHVIDTDSTHESEE